MADYGESELVAQLRWLPVLEIILAAVFIIVAYVGFSYIKRTEQSNIWVGMARETAHQLGRRVSAHAHGLAGVNAALAAGVDSIEHGSFLDDSSIKLFLERGAYHVPTIIAGMTVLEMAEGGIVLTPAQREKALIVGVRIKEALGRSYRAGVPIAFGTDMGVGPHGQNAREFALMVEAGMTCADAIKAATLTAAQLLDVADLTGSLAPGKSADLIAVAGDPLTDITELERVKFVMAQGAVALS